MKRPELLAPAGNFDSLVAAIAAGCDAVYLSGKLYGARSFAGNFSNEEIIEAVKYAHLYGVKIYVTVNTLIYDAEVPNFIEYVRFLYKSNVDALIIQDIGMFDLLRKKFPKLELHCSTQMHIHNLEGTKLMEELGASRVVLARETPIELIKEIKDNTNIELEIFVHGALCVSYSGQCLMSSLIGGRSGNRGTCAQCCRQPYELYCNDVKINEDKYIISTKDLNTLDNIGELIEANVDSLKIEGRMKRPEYVYYVVSLYRKAIDSYIESGKVKITNNDIYELKKIFNRDFTKGFIFHEENSNFINSFRPNHLGVEVGKVISVNDKYVKIKLSDELGVQDGIRIIGNEDFGMNIQVMTMNRKRVDLAYPGDTIELVMDYTPKINSQVLKTSDNRQLNRIKDLIKSSKRKIKICFTISAKVGENLKLTISDYNNIETIDMDFIVDASIKNPISKENIEKQLSKLGDTIYELNRIEYDIDDNIFIPIGVINEARRRAVEKLNEKRLYNYDFVEKEYTCDVPNYEIRKSKVYLANSHDEYENALNKDYNEVIVDYDYEEGARLLLSRVIEYHKELSSSKIMVSELGSIRKYKDLDLTSEYFLNVVNSYSVALLHSLGINKVTLSIEMNDYQIERLIRSYHERYNKHPNVEVIISLRPESMIMKYDLFNGKYNKNNNYYLKDKYNNKFPVISKDSKTIIYNYEVLKKKDYNKYYDMGVNSIRENSIIK